NLVYTLPNALAAGTSCTITLTVQDVSCDGAKATNTVQADGTFIGCQSGTVPKTASNTCDISCTSLPVSCNTVANPTSACPGEKVTLTTTATNTSTTQTEDITITIDGTAFTTHTGVAPGGKVSDSKDVTMPTCTEGNKVTFTASALAHNGVCPDKA